MKRIILNAFDMTFVSHQSAGTWRHSSSQAWNYKDLDYWTNMARELERGHFDCLFIADVVGVYDTSVTTWQTNTWRLSTSCGESRGRIARSAGISGPASLPTPARFIRARAERQGRSRDVIEIFTLLAVITGATDASAERNYQEYLSYSSSESMLALYGGWTGIDFSQTSSSTAHMQAARASPTRQAIPTSRMCRKASRLSEPGLMNPTR